MAKSNNFQPDSEEMNLIRQRAMELVGIGLYRCTFDGTVLFMDQEALKIFELEEVFPDPSSIVGKNISDLVKYADREKALRREIRKHKHVRNFEYPFQTLQEKKKWIQHDSYLVCDSKTGEEAIQAIIRDITKRKDSEEALQKSEKKLKDIINNTSSVIYLKDTQGRYLLINRQYETLFHVPKDEILGMTDYDIFPKEMADAFRENDRKVLKAGIPLEVEEQALHGDETHTYISIKFPMFDLQGNAYGVCGISTDITQRKLAEKELVRYKNHLEELVKERTARLRKVNKQLSQEITERKQSEDALQKTQSELEKRVKERTVDLESAYQTTRNILEKAPFGIYVVDTENHVDYVNPAMLEVSGDSYEQFKNLTITDLPEYQKHGLSQKIKAGLKGKYFKLEGVKYTSHFGRKTTIRNFIGIPLKEEGKRKLLMIIENITEAKRVEEKLREARDTLETRVKGRTAELTKSNKELQIEITERKRIVEALRKSEESYRTLVENINLGIILMDKDYNVIMANAEQGRMLNKNSCDFIGKKCFREFEKREHVCDHCPGKRAMATRIPQEVETEGVLDDGTRIQVRVNAFPTFDTNGKATGFIEVVENITERIQLEKRVKRSERLASMAELTTTIAHEIRNPLGAITNSIGVLKNSLKLEGKQQELMRIVMLESHRINTIINDYLKFARLRESHLIKWPITAVMRETLLLLKENQKYRSNIQIDQQYDPDLPEIWLDPDQIRQVFWNLLINAAESIPEKGCLKVEIKKHKDGKTQGVDVEITDTGIGIKPETKDKIFDLFFTTKPEGSGLGLAIVQQIMEAHKGTINIESEENVGTKTSLFIPTNNPPVDDSPT